MPAPRPVAIKVTCAVGPVSLQVAGRNSFAAVHHVVVGVVAAAVWAAVALVPVGREVIARLITVPITQHFARTPRKRTVPAVSIVVTCGSARVSDAATTPEGVSVACKTHHTLRSSRPLHRFRFPQIPWGSPARTPRCRSRPRRNRTRRCSRRWSRSSRRPPTTSGIARLRRSSRRSRRRPRSIQRRGTRRRTRRRRCCPASTERGTHRHNHRRRMST